MATKPIDVNALGEAGMAALRAGDAATARAHFEAIVSAGQADVHVWIAVATARKAMNDLEATQEALDAALKLEPQNFQALLMKGDCFASEGDSRAAMSFYSVVLRMAPDIDALPPHVAAEIRRAKTAFEEHSERMLSHVGTHLAGVGYGESRKSARFSASLDMLAGKRQRYNEEPRAYFFPGLAPIEIYPRSMFPWLAALEAATDDIAGELEAATRAGSNFEPYVHAEANRPQRADHNLLESDDWTALFLWRDGVKTEAAAHFPKTLAALEKTPLERVEGKAPMALFSKLEPGARIEPHTGFLNSRLICHLPIVTPGKAFLRVGAEKTEWRRGEAFVFNDTIEHEAWNEADATRIVLIFSIWRPELDDDERALVAALLQAVDAYSSPTA